MSTSDLLPSYHELSVIYEDDTIIAVDKAANTLSVPGKEAKPFVKHRFDEWNDAVKMAANSDFQPSSSDYSEFIVRFKDKVSIPRKEIKFYSFLKLFQISDPKLQQSIWNRIYDADLHLNKIAFEDIPNHLISTADLIEKHCGQKIYTVHRLDMETSGIMLFAKNAISCAELGRQFKDREVRSYQFLSFLFFHSCCVT
jgi:hypothetical protein